MALEQEGNILIVTPVLRMIDTVILLSPISMDFSKEARSVINPRSLLEKIVTRSLEGRVNRTPPPSTFYTIHPIDLKFGTHSKLHLYFQLSETTWCLIGFHGNNSQRNDVTGDRLLGFSNFSDFDQIFTFVPQIDGKTAFSG